MVAVTYMQIKYFTRSLEHISFVTFMGQRLPHKCYERDMFKTSSKIFYLHICNTLDFLAVKYNWVLLSGLCLT